MRFAVHDHFDRLVVPLPPGADFSTARDGSILTLRITGAVVAPPTTAAGQRMLGLEVRQGDVLIHLAADVHPHIWRIDQRLVVDLQEGAMPNAGAALTALPKHHEVLPARKLASGPGGTPETVKLFPLLPVTVENLGATQSGSVARVMPGPSAPPIVARPLAAALSGPMEVGQVKAAPSHAAAILMPPDAGDGGPTLVVPFGLDTGAAAFRRAGEAHLVFDAPVSLDLGQLRDDPLFGGMTEQLLPDGIHLGMKLAAGLELRLVRHPASWAVTVVHAGPVTAPIVARADGGVVSFVASAPGRVVVLDDDVTGGKLLIGTQRASGQSVPASHRSPEFALLPTWQGVAVVPQADRILLAPVSDGFRLAATDGPKLSPQWVGEPGRVMTRRFDFPDLPPWVLQNRLALARRDSALTPRLARFPARMRVAQASLAEGLDVEARAVVHVATADDPARSDDAAGLAAISSWLIARAGGDILPLPENFDLSSLGDSDEARFWRALLTAGQPDFSAPAAMLAATWQLLQQYPADLRRRIVPVVGEVLDQGGQEKALNTFLSVFPDPSLDILRAGQMKRQGKIDEALALLDSVARRPDRLMRAHALREAVEIRLASGKMDVAGAAAALGKQFYAWRGGPSDLALRLRVADLRAQAGQWRPALALLRETDALFGGAHARVHAAEGQIVSSLIRGDSAARLSAFDLVALAGEAAPLLSAADADVTLAPVLVDKLLALDLPERAEPILQRLFEHAPSLVQKAELGLRLAGLLADRKDVKAALAVLDESNDAGLESRLVTQRGMLRARLLVASGHASDALGILSGVRGAAAIELQAKILEDRGEWSLAAKLLESLLTTPDFAARPDQAQRELILHLANDESEAGDMAALRRLRGAQGSRFVSGSGAELFAVLTEEPIQAVGDLPRAGRELEAVRALPASLATH